MSSVKKMGINMSGDSNHLLEIRNGAIFPSTANRMIQSRDNRSLIPNFPLKPPHRMMRNRDINQVPGHNIVSVNENFGNLSNTYFTLICCSQRRDNT